MSSINATQPPAPTPYGSPPITIILAIIILVFFFFGFFSIYFCRCVMGNILRTWHFRRSPSGNLVSVACASTNQGLDPSQIQAFPTFKYSTVKDFRREKYGLECAICLSEFENESMLRLLTVCYHVFHQECIDLWLESHKTCPVCRRILDRTDESFGKASPQVDNENVTRDVTHGNEPLQDAVTIDVREDDHDHEHGHHHEEEQREREGEGEEGRRKGVESSSQGDVDQEGSTSGVDHNEICEGKLSRSHTTGHSIVRTEEDRYTLRLPDHVKCRLLRGHNWTGSCTTFGDISKNKASGNYGEAGFSGGDINRS